MVVCKIKVDINPLMISVKYATDYRFRKKKTQNFNYRFIKKNGINSQNHIFNNSRRHWFFINTKYIKFNNH